VHGSIPASRTHTALRGHQPFNMRGVRGHRGISRKTLLGVPARFALRHNGQEPADLLLGATRALAAAITALVAERAECDKLESAVKKFFIDASAISISPQPVTPSACSAESGVTTSAASCGSSAGASGAEERRRCACPGCPNGSRTRCSACKSVEYCSRACQKQHWAARKAASKVTSPGSKT
jgi:hypothetical protein